MISIEFSAAQAMEAVAAMLMRTHNLEPVLDLIGQEQREAVQFRITTLKTSPDGEAWAPWSPRRLRERTEKGNTGQGLLWDTGDLLRSITAEAGPLALTIGTPVSYADELQNGRTEAPEMPARPFIGWNPASFPAIAAQVAMYLEHGL